MEFVYDDGGRKDTGYEGVAEDCVPRAIAIATGKPYQEVYDALFALAKTHGKTKRDVAARRIMLRGGSPRNGVHKGIYKAYLESIGWQWTPTMFVGRGCTTHLSSDDLPDGTLIVRVSKHLTAIIDGVIHDTFDPSREGNRCVYGYYTKF